MFSRTTAAVFTLFFTIFLHAELVRQERVIAGSTADSMEVRHLVLRGTNEEIGRALAEIARDRYDARLEPARDRLRTRAQRRYIEKNFPILYDRMRGVAAAYDVDLNDDSVDVSQLMFTELRAGCSIAHVPPTLSATGRSVVSRDYDFTTGSLSYGALAPDKLHPTARPYLVELHPDRGYASIAMVAYDMLSGALDGMNSEGLVVTLAMDNEQFKTKQLEPTYGPAAGLGVLQMMRLLLDTCANVEEAKEALLLTKQYYEYVPVHYLVADRFGKSFIWEYSLAHNKEYIIENPGQPLVMTNFTISAHMNENRPPTSEQAAKVCKRYSYLTTKLASTPAVDEEFLCTTHRAVDAQYPATADPSNPPERTFWHALYYPEERRAKFSYYLRDEPLPNDKVRIVRSDYVELQLGGAPVAPAAAPMVSATPTATKPDATVAALQAAGANLNFERGRPVSIGLSKVQSIQSVLPLLLQLKDLRVVQLAGTDITDASLASLKELPKLEQLGLKGTKITDVGLVHLGALTRLESMNLTDTAITDAGLAHIGKMPNVAGINLTGTKITDAGLIHLQPLRRLTKLNVSKTAVTAEGVAAAKKFLPFWAQVTRDP